MVRHAQFHMHACRYMYAQAAGEAHCHQEGGLFHAAAHLVPLLRVKARLEERGRHTFRTIKQFKGPIFIIQGQYSWRASASRPFSVIPGTAQLKWECSGTATASWGALSGELVPFVCKLGRSTALGDASIEELHWCIESDHCPVVSPSQVR